MQKNNDRPFGTSMARKALTIACAGILVLLLTASLPNEAVKTLTAEQLWTLKQRTKEFKITEGPEEGKRVKMTLRSDKDNEKRWILCFGDLAVLHLERREAGDLWLHRIEIPLHDKRIDYKQPVTLIPAQIRPSLALIEKTEASVIDMKTGGVVHTGPLRHHLKEIYLSTFYTPAGTYKGFKIEIHEHLSLTFAELYLDFAVGFAPKHGIVYVYLNYTLDRMRFFGSTETHIAKLAEPLEK
jgi:hypothetical protein